TTEGRTRPRPVSRTRGPPRAPSPPVRVDRRARARASPRPPGRRSSPANRLRVSLAALAGNVFLPVPRVVEPEAIRPRGNPKGAVMEIKLAATSPIEAKVGLVALPLFEDDLGKRARHPLLASLDEALGGHLNSAIQAERFEGKAGQKLVFPTHGKIAAAYAVLVGLGKRDAYKHEAFRMAAGTVAKEARRLRSAKIALALPEEVDAVEAVRAGAEGLFLGAYRFDKWKTGEGKQKDFRITHASLHHESLRRHAAAQQALTLGLAIGEAVSLARDLVNEPAAVMTPTALAKAAADMGKAAGLQVVVHDRRKIEQLKMGMFLAVAKGSQEPPKLIEIRYVPKGASASTAAPLAFVGKAITFDSGGLSLKPADAMVDMKTDMAGAAAVIGAM